MNTIDKILKTIHTKIENKVAEKPIVYRKLDLTYNSDEDEPILFI